MIHQVPVQVSHLTPEGRPCVYLEVESIWSCIGPDSRGWGTLAEGRLPYLSGTENGSMAIGISIQRQWGGAWISRMEGCHITLIQYQTYGSVPIIWWMQCQVFHPPHPWLKVGRPRNVSSQQDTWWGDRTDHKGPHAHVCVWKPPHFPMSRRAKKEDPSGQDAPTQQPTQGVGRLWT